MVDYENGGFYGAVDSSNTVIPNAKKFIVMNARLVWTFSAAYEATCAEEYKTLATRAYEYLVKHFYDRENGGFFTWLAHDGTPTDTNKFTYGNAFAIYGLAEYARVFSCDAAKKLAIETVQHLDEKMWDVTNGGYLEAALHDWQYIITNYLTPNTRVEKTMNTHLHMVEAYTNLLRIHDTPKLRSRVRELTYTICNKILNRDNWHMYLFQARDWTPTTPDLTVGHDIEASWLLYETAEVLGEPETLGFIRTVSVNMARAALDDGVAENGAMYTEYHPLERRYTPVFSWWEQNEAVVGFLNAFQLTGEEKFLHAAENALAFIEKYFIDHKFGGWLSYLNPDCTPQHHRNKGDGYTCPYHNARMSLEILRRFG